MSDQKDRSVSRYIVATALWKRTGIVFCNYLVK